MMSINIPKVYVFLLTSQLRSYAIDGGTGREFVRKYDTHFIPRETGAASFIAGMLMLYMSGVIFQTAMAFKMSGLSKQFSWHWIIITNILIFVGMCLFVTDSIAIR